VAVGGGDHPIGSDGLAAGELYADCRAVGDENLLDFGAKA